MRPSALHRGWLFTAVKDHRAARGFCPAGGGNGAGGSVSGSGARTDASVVGGSSQPTSDPSHLGMLLARWLFTSCTLRAYDSRWRGNPNPALHRTGDQGPCARRKRRATRRLFTVAAPPFRVMRAHWLFTSCVVGVLARALSRRGMKSALHDSFMFSVTVAVWTTPSPARKRHTEAVAEAASLIRCRRAMGATARGRCVWEQRARTCGLTCDAAATTARPSRTSRRR